MAGRCGSSFAMRKPAGAKPPSVACLMRSGLLGLPASRLQGFADHVIGIKCAAWTSSFRPTRGKNVVGYGAAAKGNTFLNYCGVGPEFVRVVADRSPHKQGTLLPGSRIPVVSPEALLRYGPITC